MNSCINFALKFKICFKNCVLNAIMLSFWVEKMFIETHFCSQTKIHHSVKNVRINRCIVFKFSEVEPVSRHHR